MVQAAQTPCHSCCSLVCSRGVETRRFCEVWKQKKDTQSLHLSEKADGCGPESSLFSYFYTLAGLCPVVTSLVWVW